MNRLRGWAGAGLRAVLFLLAMAVLPLGLVGFVAFGYDGLRAHTSGIAGNVTVTGCRPPVGKHDDWTCSGPYAAEDRPLRIDHVELQEGRRWRTGSRVRAYVSGPRSRKAWPVEDFGWWLPDVTFLVAATMLDLIIIAVYAERLGRIGRALRRVAMGRAADHPV